MILFKYATRNRPELMVKALSNIEEMASGDYILLVSVDSDDTKTIDKCTELLVPFVIGNPSNKIEAINRDVELLKEDPWTILICMSDDMQFLVPGFDQIIEQDMAEHFPDGDGVLHYPDGNRGDLMTMSIMGRKYYERFNYIYHPDYKSLWCDNEATEVAQRLGKYKFINRQLFTHNHPAYKKGQMDNQYRLTESFYREDERTYQIRKAANFPLDSCLEK